VVVVGLGVAGLIVAAVLFPTIPVLGVVGSLLGNQRGGQLAVVGVLGVVTVVALWRLGRRRLLLAAAVPAAFTLVGALVVTGAQIGFAESVGAHVSAADVLRVGSPAAPPDETVVVAHVGGVDLKASIWRSAAHRATRAGVLWVHGGGFSAGSRDEQAFMARTLADHGYPVVSVDYRLVGKQLWRTETGDVVCGLSWMQAHASTLGIDPDRVTIVGGSAGGSLALNVAYGLQQRTVTSTCGATPVAPRAVAAFYPVADIAGTYRDDGLAPVSPYATSMVTNYLGGTPDAVPTHLASADPDHKVEAGLQPTLLVNGANDRLIRATRTCAFADDLAAAGNDVTYRQVPYSDHMYDAWPDTIGASASRAMLLTFLAAHA
jgi:acetyl esterase/lipase